MSSHHVIRENQEPALLVQDFNALDLDSLGQILEWSPTIICNQQSLDNFLVEDIKVDVLFSNDQGISLQEHTKLINYEGDFLEEALHYLINHNHKAVNILTSYISPSLQQLAEQINIVLFYDNKRFVYVQTAFEKWKPKNEYIYAEERFIKSFQGLEYMSAGVFKTVNDGFVHLDFNTTDFILIGEDL